MEPLFIDTSAIFAFLNEDDEENNRAVRFMTGLSPSQDVVTHNYVVMEAVSLVHRRLGPAAARTLIEDVLPRIEVVFVDPPVHGAAVSAYLAAIRRRTSLVDWVSFELMRRLRIDRAFAFDRDFAAQGFELVP